MRFVKMNGLGNDFAVFDAREAPFRPSEAFIRAIADRKLGIGCDQVFVLERATDPMADMFMRIWNADGGEVGACGNGTRCVAWLAMEERGTDHAVIQTAAGLLTASRAGPLSVTVDMGKPGLDWTDIPLAERMDTRRIDIKVGPIDDPVLHSPGAVSMGNPHCVFFVDDAESAPVTTIGPMIEHHPLFPERANVGFAQVLGPDRIRLRVWERGAGLSKACGTGACAALVAASRRGLVGRSAVMVLDGGELHVDWRRDDDHVIMTGPVEIEGEGDVTP